MQDKPIKHNTITGSINQAALDILAQHPDGVRWAELQRQLRALDPSWHPKTINGCVWQLARNFPQTVIKPETGLFRLRKFTDT